MCQCAGLKIQKSQFDSDRLHPTPTTVSRNVGNGPSHFYGLTFHIGFFDNMVRYANLVESRLDIWWKNEIFEFGVVAKLVRHFPFKEEIAGS